MSTVRALEEQSKSDGATVLLHFARDQVVLPLLNRVGRVVHRPNPAELAGTYLNLGCGDTTFDGWTNADAFKLDKIARRAEARPDWMLDATDVWPCDDNIFSGVYCEHVIEHIDYAGGIAMLRQAFRTLKPGRWIRLSAPDIATYVRHYRGEESPAWFAENFVSPIYALSMVTQAWGHVSAWDGSLAAEVLAELGFVDVRQCAFGDSTDPELARDSAERKAESFYVEGRKP